MELRSDGTDAPHPKYLVVNADEMEPGTFKDRLLMEGDPHQLIEGMIADARTPSRPTSPTSFCAGSTRWRPSGSSARSRKPTRRGYLGQNILGSGYSLELHLHVSAGRYICGEETALLNALEGKRAQPALEAAVSRRSSGLWGKPTIVNNVETLCNVPHIVSNGATWFTKAEPHRGRWHQALRRQRQA